MKKEMFSRYRHYTEHDFIADPLFCDWVLQPDRETTEFWETFLIEYPDKTEEAGIAIRFLKSVSFRQDIPDDEQIKNAFAKHLRQIHQTEEDRKVVYISRQKRLPLLWLAACLAGIAIIFFVTVFSNSNNVVPPQMAKTGYSQLQTVWLPDSSLVMLNANSSLRYQQTWKANQTREVWLSGEAYFNVRHLNKNVSDIKNGERFLVHSNGITVEVLGTSFDIRSRRGKTEIVLEKGKVKLSFQNRRQPDVIMKPGDMIAYDSAENKVDATRIDANDYTAWREKKLILTNPKVSEIVQYLEDNFGYKIEIQGKGLAERRIEGPILLTNLDDALFVLSTILNTDIIKKDSTILMRAR